MKYTIIGGLNGVGKSTIYTLLPPGEKNSLGKRINVDEIATGIGHWQDIETQMRAGKMAVRALRDCLNDTQNFHQESTLAGQSIVKTVLTAKEKGFYICLWYVYVDNIDIAKQRVLARVTKGGHGIPEDVIERRGVATLNTLNKIVPLCDEVIVCNNTKNFTVVAKVINGNLTVLDKSMRNDILQCLM